MAADYEGEPLSITAAADAGDQRALWVAMRSRLARAVDSAECPPRDLASLSRRLQDISRDIEALDAKAKQEADEDASPPDEEFDPASV